MSGFLYTASLVLMVAGFAIFFTVDGDKKKVDLGAYLAVAGALCLIVAHAISGEPSSVNFDE